MKKALYLVLAAGMCIAACNKQHNAKPSCNTGSTDINFDDNKAYVKHGEMKTVEAGVVLDYDFYIKEVSADKYVAGIRLNGVRYNGSKLNGIKFNGTNNAYKGIVIGINTTKEDAEVPASAKVETSFAILLDGAKGEKSGDVIVFDAFTYKGDLVNDVIDVTTFLTIGGGSVIIKDNSTVVLDGSNINIKENSNIVITGGSIVLKDESSFFVTRSGVTVEQNPAISKFTIRKNTKEGETVGEALGKVAVVVTGDPSDIVTGITYEPAPVALDPNKPDLLTKLPIMEFKETHYNKQLGMHRYVSTQTWVAVYGKYGIKPIIGKEGFRIQKLR